MSTQLPLTFQRIAPDVRLGRNVRIFAFVNLYGCEIGNETKIGAFVEIQKGVTVGERCKISSHTFICEGVTIESAVFIGHGVTFINDRYPRATNASGELQSEEDWAAQHTIIRQGASIGSGATILGGITVGANALVGAGRNASQEGAARRQGGQGPERVGSIHGKRLQPLYTGFSRGREAAHAMWAYNVEYFSRFFQCNQALPTTRKTSRLSNG